MDANAAMKLSNVILSDKLLEGKRKSDVNIRVNTPLNEIMWKVVTENPTWEFRVGTSRNEVARKIEDRSITDVRVNRFEVYKDGEQIGTIARNYRSSRMGSDYVFAISSNGIKNERERNSDYCTKDAKKALAAIKKTFSNKSMAERVNESLDVAKRVIYNERNSKAHTVDKYRYRLTPLMMEFALTVMQKEFEAYAQVNSASNTLAEYHNANLEMLTVDEINNKFDNGGTSLVLLLNGKYVVKTGDKIDMYDDNTLPVEIRGKLGMLKLVEPEQMIEGVGCRATTEVFVLMPTASELA